MSTKNDGGPAFPHTKDSIHQYGCEGMTLRDYFAAKALSGMLADSECKGEPDDFSKHAYMFADAMIAERSK
jgi:hypothetical protein